MAQAQDSTKTLDMKEHVKTLSGVALLDFLQSVHPSDAHVLMRDHMTEKQHTALRKGDLELRKRYFQVKEWASKSYERDHSTAKMVDVDRAATNVYTICLKMIKQQQQDINKLQDALNEERKAQGKEPIDWYPPEVVADVQMEVAPQPESDTAEGDKA